MVFNLYNTGQKAIESKNFAELNIINVPVLDIEIIPPSNGPEIHKCLGQKPILVFQSKNGVAGFSRWLESQNISLPDFDSIYVTGLQTGVHVQKYFHVKPVVPDQQNATGLFSLFEGRDKHPVLIVTGAIYREELLVRLKSDNWDVTHAMVYNTLPSVNRELKASFNNSIDEVLLFTSPSTVEGFLMSTGHTDLGDVNAKILSIGPTTSKWIRERSGTVFAEAPVPDVSAALAAVLSKLTKINQA